MSNLCVAFRNVHPTALLLMTVVQIEFIWVVEKCNKSAARLGLKIPSCSVKCNLFVAIRLSALTLF